ncbi:hypothetical protein QAD02_019107 [Eretmocerus hayati]|uniref:Uncharacterized protein n=1 Tax=Eretmocerus hayati TaxID=131215 RepID=A0ACC2PIR6_9HYME|nr:hypothetical protein QAD02_019107 [Eretmocerus hayati]
MSTDLRPLGASDFCNGESNSSRSEISSDSDVSSENRFIDDGSYFEDDLDELCATIVKHQPIEICNGTEQRHQWSTEGTGGDQGAEADIEEDEDSPMIVNSTMTPSPANDTHAQLTSIDEVDSAMGKITEQSTIPATQHQTKLDDCTPKRRRTDPSDEAALFNTSNRKSKNCATFYFKHADTDSEADNGRSGAISERHLQKQKQQQQQQQNDSSEEEWTYTPGAMRMESEQRSVRVRLDMDQASDEEQQVEERINEEKTEEKMNGAGGKVDNSDDEAKNDKESIQRLISEVEKLVREEGRVSDRRTTDLIFSEDVKAAASGLLSPQNHRAKYARIKEWLALNSARCREGRCTSQYCLLTTPETLDSCDASGEYTTGESDVEQRQTNPTNAESEEERTTRSSVVSCRLMRRGSSIGSNRPTDSHEQLQQQQEEVAGDSAGASAIGGATPKVIMRSKRSGPRPWSVSCITQISKRANLQTNGGQDDPPSFSISETALHTLISSTPNKAGSLDTAESRAPFNNSTSTLLEETIVGQDARVVRNSSLRRRKNRLRKKNVSRKSESGSDGLSTGGGANGRSEGSDSGARSSIRRYTSTAGRRSSRGSCQQQLPHHLVKSGSFSGYSVHDSCTASALVSNSSNISGVRRSGSGDGPLIQVVPPRQSSSESEDDEEEGLDAAAAVVGTRLAPLPKLIQRGLDSDVEKNSLGHNSYSEQAWDNYQEKYMSEPYSEAADIESARRLLEFCDDYRNFIDSQSDCASSLSAVRHRGNLTSEDSDSDLEFKRLAETSRTQLMVSEARYRTISDTSFSELTRVCRENIRCLRAIGEANGVSRHADKHAKQIRGLMERWESLSLRAEEAQKINSIHREMSAMKLEFCAAFERIMCYQVVLEEPHIIEERISRITNELANLRDRKPAMLALNVSTHRLITDFGQKSSPTFAALKDGVADLYRLWDEAFQKGNQKLCALQAVQQFGIRLSEFQCALRRDKDTLAVLDAALQAGATMEVASSVRDVARLLSEKHDANDQQQQSLSSLTSEESLSPDDSGNCTSGSAPLILDSSCLQLSIGSGGMTLLEGGSLSDSGISDSGSEQELSERERRLAALRRLTRGLEAQLQPGSELLTELTARIEDAEAELRLLQAHCRELIVRTAASVDARVSSASDAKSTATNAMQQASFSLPTKWKKVSSPKAPIPKGSSLVSRTPGSRTASDDPDSEPSVPPRSWVWRILRAALPFQLALLVLLCAACLLEPHCCEASNSLGLSLTPQLRYVRGPPPV